MTSWENLKRYAVVVAIVAGVILLIWLLGPLTLHWLFEELVVNRVVDGLVDVSGWNSNVVRALALLATLPLMLAVFNLFAITRKRRILGLGRTASYVVIIIYSATYLLLLAYAGRGNFFSFGEGTALKYYAVTPEGVRFFDGPGTDPRYGVELQPVTPELVDSLERAKLGLLPERLAVSAVEDIDFFDRLSGAPVVWYSRAGLATQLYSEPGIDPVYGVPLRPVTREIVHEIRVRLLEQRRQAVEQQEAALEASREASARAEQEAAERQKREAREALHRTLTRYFNLEERPNLAVQVVEPGDAIATPLNQLLADEARGSSSFLRSGFAGSDAFARAFSGDTRELEKFSRRLPPLIALGRLHIEESPSDLRQNLTRVAVVLDLRVIDVANGFQSATYRFDATSTQFSSVAALRAASEEVAQKAAVILR